MSTSQLLLSLALSSLAIAPALTGCGSDACEAASNKQKSCINSMDCNKVDPLEKPSCEQRKRALLQAAELPSVACTGEIKTRAEQILACDLDPQTCVCPR